MNEFEGKERGKTTARTNISLLRSFVSMLNETQSSVMDSCETKDVRLKNEEYLCLSSGMMKKLFNLVVERIKQHLKTLMKKPQLSKVQTMLLVGGFADSAFLQQELKTEFARRLRILIPHYTTIAVVQGAVNFGKKPAKISERVVSATFGADRSIDFIEGVHPEEKKFITDGIEKCGQLFKCFVRENSVIKLGERITRTYHPVRTNAKSLKFGFYVTSNPKAQFVTDPVVTKIEVSKFSPQIHGEVKTENLKSVYISEEVK